MCAPKAYEMMSCFEGLCELYRATGKRAYLDATLKLVESIQRQEETLIGVGTRNEVWFDGASPGGDRSRHSDAREVAAIAVEAKASRLAPVHLNPAWDPERVLQVCAAMNGIHGSVAVPLECEPIVF